MSYIYQSNWISLKDSDDEIVLSPSRLYSVETGQFLQKDFLLQMTLLKRKGMYWNSIFSKHRESFYEIENYGFYQAFMTDPINSNDIFGLKCIECKVCSAKVIFRDQKIEDLDNEYEGKPFSKLLGVLKKRLDKLLKSEDLEMPNIEEIGSYRYKSKDKNFERLSFLFFVIIDFCGNCDFFFSETRFHIKKLGNLPISSKPSKIKSDGGKFVVKAKRKKSNDECSNSIIYLDSPGVTIGGDVNIGGTLIIDYSISVGEKGKGHKGIAFHANIIDSTGKMLVKGEKTKDKTKFIVLPKKEVKEKILPNTLDK